MEIVKNNFSVSSNGKLFDEIFIKEIECEKCKSILKVIPSDIHSGYINHIDEVGKVEQGYFDELVTCPCCGFETRLVPHE